LLDFNNVQVVFSILGFATSKWYCWFC